MSDEKMALLRQWLYCYDSTIDDERNEFITSFLESIFYEIAVETYQHLNKSGEEKE